MIYLAYYCSWDRKQSVSFYFTITFTSGWIVLDTLWRSIVYCWNHPEIKYNYFFIWLQVFSLWTSAALVWISIQYAKLLQDAVDHKVALLNLMKAESDFYNIISAAEVKGTLLSILVVAQIVWLQISYQRECLKDEDPSEPPTIVVLQIQQVLNSNKSYSEMNERIKKIKTNYYTCYEALGQKPLHLTTAFISFWFRQKSVLNAKKIGYEVITNSSLEISLRYTAKLNRSSYSSIGISR